MEDKTLRHTAIKRIIKQNKIESQELLLQYLHESGFPVTQATLSRDLRQLHVVKMADGMGSYYYTEPAGDILPLPDDAYVKDFERGFLSVDFSGNWGVIKTLPGHANSIAYALDNLRIDEILGTIAGDDTVLLIPRDGIKKEELLEVLKNKIGVIKEEES